jgi:CheY-like chemotaxis protein
MNHEFGARQYAQRLQIRYFSGLRNEKLLIRLLFEFTGLGMVDDTYPRIAANILIVDDRPDNILVLKAVLESVPDYTVTTASSGPQAIELVKQTDFALILLDIQMPEMDGYQTASEIKKLERGKDVPIVMVTAIFQEDPHIMRGYAVGAIDYVSKPFNTDVFKAKVGVYTNLYLKSRQNAYLQEVHRSLLVEANEKIILQTMPIGVVVVDGSGAIQQLNGEARRIWGAGTAGLANCKDHTGWWPNTGRAIRRDEWPITRPIDKGETTLCEIIQVQSLDRTKKTVLNSATPLRNQGQISGAVDIMQDISHVQTELDKTRSTLST